MIDENVNQK